MGEVVGGFRLNDVINGGTELEIKHADITEDPAEVREYMEEAALYAKMECLDVGHAYDGQPFDEIAAKMTNLLPSGKIKKLVLREGYGEKPEPSMNVNVHYNAYVQHDAMPFDSTYGRKKPCSFQVGEGEVLEGLDLAVQSMKINEKSQFLIDPELAYKSSGLNRIPPNSTVLFEVELCSVLLCTAQNGAQTDDKDFKQVYQFCLGQCVKGKRMFRLQNYHGAIKEYNIATDKLEKVILSNYEEQAQSEELLLRLYTNLLICYTHVQNPKKACIYARQIYDMAKTKTIKISAKVYFNHAKCLRMLGEFDGAERQLNQAKKLEPKNPEILQEFLAIRKTREEYKKKSLAIGKAFVES